MLSDVYSDDAREKAEQEYPYAFTCDECGHEIEIDDIYYIINDWVLCENCLDKCRRKY